MAPSPRVPSFEPRLANEFDANLALYRPLLPAMARGGMPDLEFGCRKLKIKRLLWSFAFIAAVLASRGPKGDQMGQSRWADEYAQHPFQASWARIKAALASIEVDDQTVTTSVYELARLKRVVAYLDEILSNIDAELTPRAVWSTFHQQAEALFQQLVAYISNKNIGHITNANDNADNLLTYVRPYMVLPEAAVKALKRSASSYVSELGNYLDAFRDKAVSVNEQLTLAKETSVSSLSDIESSKSSIQEYARQLFEGTDQTPSIQNEIEGLLTVANANTKQISDLQSVLLIGTPQVQSTQAKVKAAEAEIVATRDKTLTLLDSVQGEVRQLAAFHDKIFGKKDEVSGKANGGLEFELDIRTAALKTLEDEQKIKHEALFLRIESLLPGATSAGLATAYKSLKDSFEKPIARYTKLFYGSLGVLVLAALVMAVNHVTLGPVFSIYFVEVPEWDVILKALIYKAPFIAPVVWLAMFSSTRRSQYERLQQEYAHKEALASSYESYKKQLQDLKGDSEALQRELITKAIDCVAYNASTTLDGKHEDKSPSSQLFEMLSLDELKKLIDFARTTKVLA